MIDFYIKKGDALPLIRSYLKNGDGTAVNLAGCSVRFLMALPGATDAKVDAAGLIEDDATGLVSYSWDPADTDLPGTYNGEWEVTFPSTKKERFPNSRYLEIKVMPSIA